VALATLLRPPAPPTAASAEPAVAAPVPPALPEREDLLREVRVFRARLADAFDDARAALAREFATAVLGRELLLAPPDLARIAARLLAAHAGSQPVRLRVAPGDVPDLAARADALPPLAADATLAPGDAVLELAGGSVDARLGVRLAAVLEAYG
jgi:flagellar biosynthesis/type III secretory pathway protein FliH